MGKLGFPPKMERVGGCTAINIIFSHPAKWCPHCTYQTWQGSAPRRSSFTIAICHCYRPIAKKILDLATEEDHLVKFKGKQVVMRTSIYADDTAIFVKPYKKDVTALADILTKFGEVSGLKTNVQKSSVIPIRCQGVDLDEVLHDFPARRALVPTKYLGLPLTSTRLRRIDFQPLVDKAVSKLTVWNGKNINHAGRSTLVKAVLTSQVVYCLISLRAPKTTQ